MRTLHPGAWIVDWKSEVGADPQAAGRHGSHVFQRWLQAHARVVLDNAEYRILRVV